MTTQTTKNSIMGKFFGRNSYSISKKSISGMIILFAAMFFTAQSSFAQNGCIKLLGQTSGNCTPTTTTPQSTDLYYQSNGAYFGKVTAYHGSHYRIHGINGGLEVKTFANSCKKANTSGASGYLCSFAQFNNSGRQIHSGWGYFFDNGLVYLWYSYEFLPYQRQIDQGWYAFRP